MYLLLLTLLGSGLSVTFVSGDERAERYLLPRNVIPSFYDVKLFFDPDNTYNFTGEVSIRVVTVSKTSEIVLHALQIFPAVVEVFHASAPTTNLLSHFRSVRDDTQFLILFLNRELAEEEPVTIRIEYESWYVNNMFGVYVSTYNIGRITHNLVTSQLQPTYARNAFPCFDEPDLKAIFRTTIYAPAKYPVVKTNMPLREDLLKADVQNWVKHEFQDTPYMSTYLNGFLVANFSSIGNIDSISREDSTFRVPFNIYSRPLTQFSAAFALDFGQKSMVSLENYYGFNYALPKLDKVAVPDFAAGAMENWGLCIYREAGLLVRDGETPTASRQNVARLITHENVHLWIGNEVTPISWTYLWLSEGLATFFDHYGTDFVLPKWRMSDQFLLGVQNVFQADAVLSVNPMTHPVYSPSEILGTFNAVAYQKSGSVIRMLQHILTPEVFQQGIIYYINAMSRKAAAPVDLYTHLQRALDNSNHTLPYSVEEIMESWVNQGGFPVITIRRSASTANSVSIHQERYLTDRSLSSPDRWYVPINWATSSDPDFYDTKPMLWLPRGNAISVDIPGFSNTTWFIFNKQQTGYYRVNYDEGNWAALINVLTTNHTPINVLNRANLLDDAFNLARNGRLNYNHALNLSRYLINETDYIPWGAVNPAFTYLDVVLSGTADYEYFQNYLRNLTEPLYQRLGFNATAEEEHVTAFLRNIILDLNCRHGNEHCINTSATILGAFRNSTYPGIHPDLQTLVFCASLRGGSAENYDFLWNRHRALTDSGQQSTILNALGCTSHPGRRSSYMNQVIDPFQNNVRDQDKHTVLVSVINSGPEGAMVALDFIIDYFHIIQRNVQGLTGTTSILNAFARRLSNETHSEKMDIFVRNHQSRFTAGERAAVAAIRENIAASIAWRSQNAATVQVWLKEHYGNDATACVLNSSFMLLITIFIMIFNR